MGIFTRRYEIRAQCSNCGSKNIIRIPKGITIKEHLAEKQANCSYCGCDTIELIENGEQEQESID